MAEDDLQIGSFSFVFPLSLVNLGNGIFKMNDSLSDGASILSTQTLSLLSIDKKDNNAQFKVTEGSTQDELLIKKVTAELIIPPTNGGKRLVILDPGHGGTDPGAVFEGIYESNINLDITLRAEAILKQKGIDVSLTRRADAFVGLDERCNLANNMAASLFVSIHQNSMPDPLTKGTMLMYYASSFNGKAYAQMMLDMLAPAVGLGNLGLKSSSGLVVLRKTKMPAILAEVACMSNTIDMQVIKTEDYRQKAAVALADGIVNILATMR